MDSIEHFMDKRYSELTHAEILQFLYHLRIRGARECDTRCSEILRVSADINAAGSKDEAVLNAARSIIDIAIENGSLTHELIEQWNSYFEITPESAVKQTLEEMELESRDVYTSMYNVFRLKDFANRRDHWLFYYEAAHQRSRIKKSIWEFESKIAKSEFEENERERRRSAKNRAAQFEIIRNSLAEIQQPPVIIDPDDSSKHDNAGSEDLISQDKESARLRIIKELCL